MKKNSRHISIIFAVLLSLCSWAQNENKKWYFGNGAGLDFMSTPPTILSNSSMTFGPQGYSEGVSSVADGAGALLFYTDGITIWNKNHQVMANGTGLYGSKNSSQSALIVKQPGNNPIYYLFTTPATSQTSTVGLRYSIIDMSLASGTGSVIVKNTLLHLSSTEKVAATRHCNGKDFWIISHVYPGDEYYCHLLTPSGIMSAPVISTAGSSLNNLTGGGGCLKVSPNGRKLGNPVFSVGFDICDFDNSTGVISNALTIPTYTDANVCEFSSDGTKFYGSMHMSNSIYQWDLCSSSNAALISSVYAFASTNTGQMQLAPDHKIYVSHLEQNTLGVINNPNIGGPGCGYTNSGQSISPRFCSWGLPNLVSNSLLEVQNFSYITNQIAGCLTATFTAPSNWLCSVKNLSIAAMRWNFGDPASGQTNTSQLGNPMHLYSAPGIYPVQLTLYNICGSIIDTLKQNVLIAGVPITSTMGFTVCSGEPLILSANSHNSYTWSTGANTSSILIVPTVNSSYTVEAANANGCINRSIQIVTVNPLPVVTIAGEPYVCPGTMGTLTAMGASGYSWNIGAFTSIINVLPVNSTYIVTGTDGFGCTNSAAKTVILVPNPNLSITGNTTICSGSNFTLQASGANSYTWNVGVVDSILKLRITTATPFTVTGTNNYGCSNQQTISLSVNPSPNLSIKGGSRVCPGSALTQTASGANTYTWSNGVTGSTVTLSPSVSVTYILQGTGQNGCEAELPFFITVKSLPQITVNSPTVCPGLNTVLTATAAPSNTESFVWYPGALTGSSIQVSPQASRVYTVRVYSDGCYTEQTTLVSLSGTTAAITNFSYMPVCRGNSSITPLVTEGFMRGGSFSSEQLRIDPSDGILNSSALSAGIYTINYAYPGTGCITPATTNATLEILDAPQLLLRPDTNINFGASLILKTSGSNNYSWSHSESLNCDDCENPVASPNETTEYCVTSVLNSCISKKCILVSVGCENAGDLSVPNAFTPNGDGTNDEFCLRGWDQCIIGFEIRIFNRWGELVFSSRKADFCWNGIFKDQVLNSDVFIYYISAIQNNKNISKKGNISLIR